MLGYTFLMKPTVQKQVDTLIRKASKRKYMLGKYKTYGVDKQKLKTIYTSNIRSVLEYTSNTYHSQLNKGQINQLKRTQKQCLKIIYGYGKSYPELLLESGLNALATRRETMFERFTKNNLEIPKYKDWFPLKTDIRETRKVRPYLEERATSNRLYRSPLYAMRRLLNEKPPVEPELDNLTGAFNIT